MLGTKTQFGQNDADATGTDKLSKPKIGDSGMCFFLPLCSSFPTLHRILNQPERFSYSVVGDLNSYSCTSGQSIIYTKQKRDNRREYECPVQHNDLSLRCLMLSRQRGQLSLIKAGQIISFQITAFSRFSCFVFFFSLK